MPVAACPPTPPGCRSHCEESCSAADTAAEWMHPDGALLMECMDANLRQGARLQAAPAAAAAKLTLRHARRQRQAEQRHGELPALRHDLDVELGAPRSCRETRECKQRPHMGAMAGALPVGAGRRKSARLTSLRMSPIAAATAGTIGAQASGRNPLCAREWLGRELPSARNACSQSQLTCGCVRIPRTPLQAPLPVEQQLARRSRSPARCHNAAIVPGCTTVLCLGLPRRVAR